MDTIGEIFHCNTLPQTATPTATAFATLTATQINTLQHTATHYHTATLSHSSRVVQQTRTAIYCNTHRNTLQHTTTRCNTIGDAYIAAEWISKRELQLDVNGVLVRRAYSRLLWLGGVMIQTVAEVRRWSGVDLHCRIGIGRGLVLAGALGWLQPRFHLRGPAVQMAELLEQSAEIDSVNVLTCFLHLNLEKDMEVPAGWSQGKRHVHEYHDANTSGNGTCRRETCECMCRHTSAVQHGAPNTYSERERVRDTCCVSYSLLPLTAWST